MLIEESFRAEKNAENKFRKSVFATALQFDQRRSEEKLSICIVNQWKKNYRFALFSRILIE